MKILAIKWRRLGDTVLWTSALEALNSIGAIDIALPEAYTFLFQDDPRIKNTFALKDSNLNSFHLVRKFRKEKYDCILNFHASATTAWITVLSAPLKKLIHHHSRKRKNYFSDKRIIQLGEKLPAIERDLNVVRTLGWSGIAPDTKIYLKESPKPCSNSITVGLGASRPSKIWPLEKWVKLCAISQSSFQFIYESESVFDGMTYWKNELLKRAKLTLTPNLKSACESLTTSKIYIGPDSGLKHLAIALGKKTLTLFGPESPYEWHPYPISRHPYLQADALCRSNDKDHSKEGAWCGAYRCPHGSHICLNLIDPISVEKEIQKLLQA